MAFDLAGWREDDEELSDTGGERLFGGFPAARSF